MWGNTATTGNEIYVNSGTASANYSLFNPAQSNGTISGSNNQNSDPLFTDANGADNVYGTEDDDLSLQSSSPALDNASSSVANYSTTDLLGRSRSGNPDRSAYEFIPAAPPVFTSSSSFSVQENQTNIGTVTATDANGDALSFSIGGGTDQAKFSIHSVTGDLGFTSPPDFENPTDSDLSSVYQVTVTVSDGTHSVQQAVSVTVTGVSRIPHRRNHCDHRSGRKRRPARRLARLHLLRVGRRRIPDAQLGLSDRFRLPGLRITPRRNPSHRNHLGQRLPERTSKRVRRAYVALLDPSGNLHNPPVTNDAWINYQYQSPGGGGGGGGGQSPTGGTIAIITARSETPTSTPTCASPSLTHRAEADTRRPIGPTGSIPPSRPTDHPTASKPQVYGGTTAPVNDFLNGQFRLPKRDQASTTSSTPPFLTQAATSTTRPSPTTHGSTTNTSRPAAAAVEAEEV